MTAPPSHKYCHLTEILPVSKGLPSVRLSHLGTELTQRGTGWSHLLLPTQRSSCVHLASCGLCCEAFPSSEANSLFCYVGSDSSFQRPGPRCLSLVLGLSSPWSLYHGCCLSLSVCLSIHVIYNLYHKLCTPQESVFHYMDVPESISPAEGRLVCSVFEL